MASTRRCFSLKIQGEKEAFYPLNRNSALCLSQCVPHLQPILAAGQRAALVPAKWCGDLMSQGTVSLQA